MPENFLVSASEAARLVGLSRSSFYQAYSCGAIGPVGVRIGGLRKTLFDVDELRRWVSAGCPPRREWERDGGRT